MEQIWQSSLGTLLSHSKVELSYFIVLFCLFVAESVLIQIYKNKGNLVIIKKTGYFMFRDLFLLGL